MLSLFPDLLSFAIVVPFLFRLLLAVFFFRFGAGTLSSDQGTYAFIGGISFIALGILFFIGLYTQAAALIGTLALLLLTSPKARTLFRHTPHRHVLLLLALISFSLLFLGAGIISIDLPL